MKTDSNNLLNISIIFGIPFFIIFLLAMAFLFTRTGPLTTKINEWVFIISGIFIMGLILLSFKNPENLQKIKVKRIIAIIFLVIIIFLAIIELDASQSYPLNSRPPTCLGLEGTCLIGETCSEGIPVRVDDCESRICCVFLEES